MFNYINKNTKNNNNVTGDDAREGLTCVISIKLPDTISEKIGKDKEQNLVKQDVDVEDAIGLRGIDGVRVDGVEDAGVDIDHATRCDFKR